MNGSTEIKLSWSLMAASSVMMLYYLIAYEIEQRKVETVQPVSVIIQPGYVACIDEIAAQQALIINDINVLIDSGRCLPTEEIKTSPADIIGVTSQLYHVRVNLPDDLTAELWLPIGATN
jgi:hypothetical protein